MKEKIINLKNKVIDFLKNQKSRISTFMIANKKLTISITAILSILIAIIIVMCNKSQIGNTSGNLNNLGFSVENGGWVYYLGLKDSNTDGIYKVKANSDKKEKISSDYGLYLNKLGNFIYYLDRTSGKYNIAKIKLNGEDKETILEDVDTEKITVVDNWIYYFKDGKFCKSNIKGKEKQILLTKSIGNYEINGKWIYYSYINNGKYVISKMKTNGEDVTKIDNDSAKLFFVKGNNIYYIYEKYNEDKLEYNYELYKVKTNGKDKEKISDINSEIQIDSINFNEDKIFYIRKDENDILSIYSVDLDGKNETKIIDIEGDYTKININDKWIYYTDQNENGDSEMFRIKINGKDKESLSL